jgi:hypothetical protein
MPLPSKRCYAEYLDGLRVRFFYPCGHYETIDYAKKPVPKRPGQTALKMLARFWSKENGGVTAKCKTCAKKRAKS